MGCKLGLPKNQNTQNKQSHSLIKEIISSSTHVLIFYYKFINKVNLYNKEIWICFVSLE